MPATAATAPRPPVLVAPAVVDRALIDRLVDEHQPYWPVQRYIANRAEYAALSGDRGAADMPVAPVFRGDWAVEGQVLPGVEPLLENAAFVDGARRLFGAEVVRPHTVYANLTWQLPFAQGRGHTDIPAFRGFDRRQHPVPFLTIMGLSGLFEAERIHIATAVSWFYAGADGGFEYWPDGPDAPSVVHEGAIDDTAVVGDNDFMWHRVRPTGRPEDGMVTLSLDSELVRVDETTWAIVDCGAELARFPRSAIRVSVSWKADVFVDEDEARLVDEHVDDLSLDAVLARFADDLRRRGIDVDVPEDDPERDPAFVEVLQRTYVRFPTTGAPA